VIILKVKDTNWSWLIRDKDIQQVLRNLENINMSVTETFGKYQLHICHSFKMMGSTYYDLRSKDLISACNEADDIAREEFTRMHDWNTRLIDELGDN
jgi:hypothetical protein